MVCDVTTHPLPVLSEFLHDETFTDATDTRKPRKFNPAKVKVHSVCINLEYVLPKSMCLQCYLIGKFLCIRCFGASATYARMCLRTVSCNQQLIKYLRWPPRMHQSCNASGTCTGTSCVCTYHMCTLSWYIQFIRIVDHVCIHALSMYVYTYVRTYSMYVYSIHVWVAVHTYRCIRYVCMYVSPTCTMHIVCMCSKPSVWDVKYYVLFYNWY